MTDSGYAATVENNTVTIAVNSAMETLVLLQQQEQILNQYPSTLIRIR